ncbi:MAG: ATP-binding protein [Treponema sp.]|nr:ATP-binding protein [Treponema sp.]
MKKFKGIKTRITIYTLIPVAIGFVVICSIMSIFLFNMQQSMARAEFQDIVRKHTSNFEKRLHNSINYLTYVSHVLEFQISEGAANRELTQRMLLEFFNKHSDINSSSIYFEPNMFDGRDSLYKGTNFGSDHSGRISFYFKRENGKTEFFPFAIENDAEFLLPFYAVVKELNTPIYTEPTLYNIDGEDILMFIIVFPIRNANGEFIGAVTADIYLGDFYRQLHAEKIYETGYLVIGTDKEQVLYSPKFEDIGKTRREAGLLYPFPEATEEIIIFNYRSIVNNKKTLTAIDTIYIPELNSRFSISVAAPVEEINAAGTILVIVVSVLCIIVIALTAFFLSYFIGKLTKPLSEFTEYADKLGDGDFNVRIKGDYGDEFGILKDTVNLMAERIEEHVEESKITLRVLQTILNGIDAYIYVTVPGTGEILFINERMKKMFNLKGDEGIGQYCYKLFREGLEERCSFCPCFELDKNPDSVVVWEERVPELDRDMRHTDIYIDWPGGFKVHMQQAIDITDIKTITKEKLKAEREAQDLVQKKEQAEETSRMKSVFLASMSHEIRTPMHGIIGFSDLALDDNISPKTRNYISKIKTSAESLLLIINDILDVSKIEAGKIELENIPFNIGDVFKLCRLIASPNAQEKGLTLFCYAEPSVGKLLLGDPTRLRQILLNLISNAIKFTNNGMVKLLAAITKSTSNTVTMHFEVKDSGIGMTEDQIKRVFKPFIQADDSTTRKYGGTGLGLTITNSFVELMGGKLIVESSTGVGSKFSFDLTFETIDSKDNAVHTEISLDRNEKPFFEGEILVCEDNELNQIVISEHLEKVGLKTVIAQNGKLGVELVQKRLKNGEKSFDLIFMDIHMPEMDGLEAARKIIEIGSRVPIVALTANVMTNDRETYFASGMIDCLPKPFVVQELWACLQKYLTPVRVTAINTSTSFSEEEDQKKEIITVFIKSNQNTYKNINEALESGDIKLAHRLAHTLKGVAGLIGRNSLAEAAKFVEQSLALGKVDQLNDQMNSLERELNNALTELAPFADNYTLSNLLSNKEILELLDKLDTLLEADNYESVNFVKNLRNIAEMEKLSEQVENMKFKQAREILASIKQQMEQKDG